MHFVGQRNQDSESAGLQRRSLDIKSSDRLADALDRSSSSGYVSSESTSSQVNNERNSGLCNLFLGSLSNDDGDGRENVKKPIGLCFLCMCNALFFVHFFAVTSRLRRENAQFDGLWRTWTQDNFLFLFLNFDTVFLELNSRSICQIWLIERDGISTIKFEVAQIPFWKWRFHWSRRRCCLSSLLSYRYSC